MGAGPPRVAVVIPNLDGGEALGRCLRSIPPGVEVVVVDNGSRDDSPRYAERTGATVVRNASNLGFAAACNRGAAATSAGWILFLNNDAELQPDSLETLVREASAASRGAVWQAVLLLPDGTVESAGDLFTRSGFFWHRLDRPPTGGRPEPVFAAKGACMLFRRSAFIELGGFRESYFAYFEETDVCWRARLCGYEVFVVPGAVAKHASGGTSSRILAPHEVRYLSYRNRLRSILTNASTPLLVRMLPVHVAVCLAAAVVYLVTGRARSAFAVVRALLHPLVERGWAIEREQVQRERVVDDADLLRSELTMRLGPRRLSTLARGQLFRWERRPGGSRGVGP